MGVERVQWLRQIHSAQVVEFNRHSGPEPEADGSWTRTPGLALGILHADCIALVLVDPVTPAIANVHCGWRGVAGGVVEAAVYSIAEGAATGTEGLWAALSAAIGPCCYEFRGWWRQLPSWMWPFVRQDRLDLPGAVIHRLKRLGVRPGRILAPPACTSCDGRFFSHRREGVGGRNGTVVVMKRREEAQWRRSSKE